MQRKECEILKKENIIKWLSSVLLKFNKTQNYAPWKKREKKKMRFKYQVKIKWGPEWDIDDKA